jgi:replicative DNA helicase
VSANIEYQVLCKIIEIQDFHTVEKLRIDETFFLSDSQTKEVFRFIRDHFHNEHTYGSVPSWQLVTSRFNGFPWMPSYDALPSLCQELRRIKVRAQLLALADYVNINADTEPHGTLVAIRESIAQMAADSEISNDMFLSAAYEQLYTDYNMLAQSKGVIGIPYPWDLLNDDTQGMLPGQFIVIYGRPKSMKTWVALVIAVFAYLRHMRVLIWSLEMNEMQMLRRIAAIIGGVDYDKFKKAKLDTVSADAIWQILQSLKSDEMGKTSQTGHTPALLVVQPRGTSTGIMALQTKIKEFKPDLVVVDGMYLMRDDRQKIRTIDWKAVAHISQDLKHTATQFNIPIIGITQANRSADKDPKKADLAELAYADAIAQDCDLCLRVHKQKDQSTNDWEIVLSIAGGRETQLDAFVINGMAAYNFGFKRALVSDPNNPQTVPASAPPGSKKGGGNAPPILPSWGR